MHTDAYRCMRMQMQASLIERGDSFHQDGDIPVKEVAFRADVTAALKAAKLTPANSRHYGDSERGTHAPKRGK